MITAEVAQYLDDNSFGTYDPAGITGNIFLEVTPATPDICISVYTTPGQPPDIKTNLKRPSVQIQVRGDGDPRTAYDIAKAILDSIHGLHNTTLVDGGTRIMLISARDSEPGNLGRDDNGRFTFSCPLYFITGGE